MVLLSGRTLIQRVLQGRIEVFHEYTAFLAKTYAVLFADGTVVMVLTIELSSSDYFVLRHMLSFQAQVKEDCGCSPPTWL